VYRHFPLPPEDLHPYKQLAAEFAEAAAARDRFWGVHDWLFEHYYEIDRSFLHRTELMFDLHPEAVEAEMSAGLYHDRVIRDHTGGLGSGVVQAPTLFVNGRRLDTGPTPAEVMAELVPTLDRSAG
jgi:protein-disulfide isomerase